MAWRAAYDVGLRVDVCIASADLRMIYTLAYPFFLVIVVMLVGVELFGTNHGGPAWLDLGLSRATL